MPKKSTPQSPLKIEMQKKKLNNIRVTKSSLKIASQNKPYFTSKLAIAENLKSLAKCPSEKTAAKCS